MIYVIDWCGVIIKIFGSDVFECLWGVCVMCEGKIVVCDWGSVFVKEFF